ncbi:hypothetical protein GCM10007147_43030 [Nocardiopsis kunsanensis]|uniref:Uncharacterized protein n=1 Tax=Nocardiopsis kunsanensis TaxID=141693 RepID=A0A918XL87_9ACTN|nr:hypothetical protein [Nocardiopsis kunsanensis]GHD36045.1 hypothetical protein GCM10007147_43030 [Nocardiopsis kunsanensis]
MTSDETPRDPQEAGREPSAGATGPTENTGPTSAGDTGPTGSAGQQWSSPTGSPGASDGEHSGARTEPHPQTWSRPPEEGKSRTSGRLPASAWLVTLVSATVHAVTLTLVLALSLPFLGLAWTEETPGLLVTTLVVATALTVFLFWVFRRMLTAALFPRPVAAMVLFTAIVLVASTGSVVLQLAFGLGESAEGMLTAGMLTVPPAALLMLVSRGTRVRWAAGVSALLLLVAGAVVWARGDTQAESMVQEQRRINLGHEDEAAVLDAGGWEPYRSEINDAAHEAGSGEGSDDGGSEAPGTGETDGDEWLSVFTVFYQDGNGGYLRSATWADETTAQDPDGVLRAWCEEEGAYCEDVEVEGADGPVVVQWGGVGGSEAPEDSSQLGAPESVRYEYEPGRVVYLGPWTGEPDRARAEGPTGVPGASPGGGPTLGHDDFTAQELAEWATRVRPAQREDLVELADRTVEYFQGPEEVLTGD